MFKPLHHILNIIEHQPGWETQQQFRQILKHWSEVVGATVAAHTRPTGIYRGVLWVATSSSIWSQELTYKRLLILSKLSAKVWPEVSSSPLKNLVPDFNLATPELRDNLESGTKGSLLNSRLDQADSSNQTNQTNQYSPLSDRPIQNFPNLNPNSASIDPQATKNFGGIKDIRFSPGQWLARSEEPPVLVKHPSYLPPPQEPPLLNRAPSNTASSDQPDDSALAKSRSRWQQIQARSANLPLCDQCQCPTPPGEIDRWGCCSLCVTKKWTR